MIIKEIPKKSETFVAIVFSKIKILHGDRTKRFTSMYMSIKFSIMEDVQMSSFP